MPERQYVPTALTKRDALIHDFAHEGLLATGRDHLNVGARANLREKYISDIVWGRVELMEQTALGKSSFAAAVRMASSALA
jgi:hypothetical protein